MYIAKFNERTDPRGFGAEIDLAEGRFGLVIDATHRINALIIVRERDVCCQTVRAEEEIKQSYQCANR